MYANIQTIMSLETMPSPSPEKLRIDNDHHISTADFRKGEVFSIADPDFEVPDVRLAPADPNPLDKYSPMSTRVGIHDGEGSVVGTFNLVQPGGRTWVRDIRIEGARQGKHLGVATYLGLIAAAAEVGRRIQSDPQGLSDGSSGVWQSLVRRGVAEVVEGEFDTHGHPCFISR